VADERDAYQILGVGRRSSLKVVRTTYWQLARRFHPDGTAPDVGRMSEINAAYEAIERDHATGASDAPGTGTTPAETGPPEGSLLRRMRDAQHADSAVVDFGQYAGWRIADIARHDPRYLRWLSRQVSGVRYRAEIERVLGQSDGGTNPATGD
jgi:DnaJ-class molecular chaperone